MNRASFVARMLAVLGMNAVGGVEASETASSAVCGECGEESANVARGMRCPDCWRYEVLGVKK